MIIWLFLRHFKVYHWAKYIPISMGDKFNIFVWDNWVWKSSVLEALDCFFNDPKNENKKWVINLRSKDWWKTEDKLMPFVAPVFFIKKSEITDSELFSNLTILDWVFKEIKSKKIYLSDFSDHINKIFELENKDDYFVFSLWVKLDWELFFHYFRKKILKQFDLVTVIKNAKENNEEEDEEDENLQTQEYDTQIQKKLLEKFKNVYDYVKSNYLYLYFSLDMKPEEYTKLEKHEMQKLINRDLKDSIYDIIWWEANINKINNNLWDFLLKLEKELVNYRYKVDWTDWISKDDLINKIIEVYFSKRTLELKQSQKLKDFNVEIKNLSSWEKRKILIDLASIYLKNDNQSKNIILWIDEPEASLHTSKCYNQFKKLFEISTNSQILVTTHWYWFIPVISKWSVNILKKIDLEDVINFTYLSLENYTERIAKFKKDENIDIELKSRYDLVNSIFSSLREWWWDWIICEWFSDKVYLEWFINILWIWNEINIIPVWWIWDVTNIYNFLQLPLSTSWENVKNKVYCLIDTDSDQQQNPNTIKDNEKLKDKIIYKRLCNKSINDETSLLNVWYSTWSTMQTDIEDSLNPKIYLDTLKSFSSEIWISFDEVSVITESKNSWNYLDSTLTQKSKIKTFFKWSWNKTKFATKYIELTIEKTKLIEDKNNVHEYIPNWFYEIVKDCKWWIWTKEFKAKTENIELIVRQISYKNYNLERLNNYKYQKDIDNKKLKAKKYVIDDILYDNSEITKEDAIEILKDFYSDYWSNDYLNSKEFIEDTEQYLSILDNRKYYYLTMRWSNAKWIFNNGKIIVLKDSTWLKSLQTQEIENKWYAYRNRPKLISEWIIKEIEDNIIFIKDYEFDSPSSAASLVTWWSFNWWDVWKDENWKTLDEIERKKIIIFNLEDFIQTLKKLWAKWALTMTLRWSNLNLIWNKFEIETKTKISFAQINTLESKHLIWETLKELYNIEEVEIIIK